VCECGSTNQSKLADDVLSLRAPLLVLVALVVVVVVLVTSWL